MIAAAVSVLSETVRASVPESVRPELARAVVNAVAEPVIVVADTVTATDVAASMRFRFAADTVLSATVAV